MTNMINTSSNTQRQYEQLRREIAQQDVYRAFVMNANSIAPQEHRAYLLKSRNPISSVIIGAADTGKDVVELGKALVSGKSNDNQLGRFNDLGMKLGSLGIASYLCTRRGTGTKGIMEFFGFGAFFASMAAWPRILISEPLKLLYGFDIRQQYVDAQGRKKRLYLDNQFIPDLHSNEEIDRIADKLGVDKSNPDYRQVTKDKMRTIALQGNTLWMLTAGFSPLLTSLVCNVGERFVTKAVVHRKQGQLTANVDNLAKITEDKLAPRSKFDIDAVQDVISIAEERRIHPDDEFYAHASRLLDPFRAATEKRDFDDGNLVKEMTSSGARIREYLETTYINSKATERAGKTVNLKETLAALSCKNITYDIVNPSTELADAIFAVMNAKYKDIAIDHHVSIKEFENIVEEAAREAAPDLPEAQRLPARVKEGFMDEAVKSAKKCKNPNIEIALDLYEEVRKIYFDQTRPVIARIDTISDFVNGLVGQKYESVFTSIHLDAIKELMGTLNPSMEDLDLARNSVENSEKYLVGRLSKLAGSEGYGAFITKMSEAQIKYEAKVFDEVLPKVKKYAYDSLPEVYASIPDGSPLEPLKNETKGAIRIPGVDGTVHRAPLFKRVIDLFIEEKGEGIRATGHRYLLAADLEKRIQTGELKEFWTYLGGSDETFEKAVKYCRDIAYNSTMNDLSNKFYFDGAGDDATRVVRLMFGSVEADGRQFGLSQVTRDNCSPGFCDLLERTRQNIIKIYRDTTDLARQGHAIQSSGDMLASQKTQYSMVGKSVSELFMETASQKFNDKYWMKMFGGLGIAVVAGTLLSQLFFGKTKDEEIWEQKKNAAGGVGNASK